MAVVVLAASGTAAMPAAADSRGAGVAAAAVRVDERPGSDARVAAAAAALPELVRAAMAKTGAPGVAVSVVHKGRVLYAQGFGVRDVDTKAPVTAETVFQLASFSKSIGASVVAAAIGRKVATWDTPVRRLMPSFALKDPYVTRNVTIGDLYTMRSGLPAGAADILESVGFDRAEVLRRLRYLDLAPFRVDHQYTNFGMTAAAQAIATAARTSWETLSQRLIYGPLGMRSTSSRYSDFLKRSNRAALHVKIGGRMVSRYARNPDAQSPAGGVSSNVVDLARWMMMELAGGRFGGKQVVASAPLAAAQTAQSRTTAATTGSAMPRFYGYGMGVSVGRSYDVRLTHSGAFTQGAGTAYLMIPQYGVGITVLANAMVGLPEIVTTSFADLVETGAVAGDYMTTFPQVFASYYAPNPALEPGRKPSRPAAGRAAAALVGTYANPFWGKAEVVRRGSALQLLLGPDRVVVPLQRWNGDVYAGTFGFGTDWPYRATVTFTGGTRGRARAVVLDLGPSQVGTLVRRG